MKKQKWKNLGSNEDVPIGHLKNSTTPSMKMIAFVSAGKRTSMASQDSPKEQQYQREDHNTNDERDTCAFPPFLFPPPRLQPQKRYGSRSERGEMSGGVDCASFPLQDEVQVFLGRVEKMIMKLNIR